MGNELSYGFGRYAFRRLRKTGCVARCLRALFDILGLSRQSHADCWNGEQSPDGDTPHLIQLRDLLRMVAPRIDHRRIAAFYSYHGGLAGALAARSSLEHHFGAGSPVAQFIPLFHRCMVAALRERTAKQPLGSADDVVDYLRARLANQPIEVVLLMLIDAAGRLISEVVLNHGGLDQVDVQARAVMTHALDLGAAWLILAHNHPSGNPSLSKGDIAATQRIVEAGWRLGVRVHDHIVVGGEGYASMRESGLL